MKKVLIIHSALAPYRIDIFNYLNKKYDLRVIFLREDVSYFQTNQGDLRVQLKPDALFLTKGCDVNNREFYRKDLINEIRRFNPEIVVTYEFSFITIQVALLKIIKRSFYHFTWTADNVHMLGELGSLKKFSRKVLSFLLDGVIVYSEAVADVYKDKFKTPRKSIGVFPNVQREFTLHQKRINGPIAALDDNRFTILYVGRLAPEKNLNLLFDAFSSLLDKGLDAQLLVVGAGAQGANLKKSYGHIESVHFLGPLYGDALDECYMRADLFVLPSTFELYGAVVNEALLRGVPVICSNVAGASELIDSGRNGYIFNVSHGADSLAMILEEFIHGEKYIPRSNASLMAKSFDEMADGWLPEIARN